MLFCFVFLFNFTGNKLQVYKRNNLNRKTLNIQSPKGNVFKKDILDKQYLYNVKFISSSFPRTFVPSPKNTPYGKAEEIEELQETKSQKTVSALPVRSEIKRHDITEEKIILLPQEKELLERLVEAEAGGEPFEGKLAVVTVVINRINSSSFPNTLYDVVFQKNQFTPAANGGLNKIPSEETKKAVEKVINGYRSFNSDVVFFLNPKIATDKWIIDNRIFVIEIGQHCFYK